MPTVAEDQAGCYDSCMARRKFKPKGSNMRWVFLLMIAGAAPLRAQPATPPPVDADILLSGGLIVDGLGTPGRAGDVAVRDGKIVGVGKLSPGKIRRKIDCRGLVVCPGFIDLHTHSDEALLKPATRANVNYLLQGVTTVVTGNCGFGVLDAKQYFQRLDASRVGTNVIHLLPHGALREAVMGKVRRAPTPTERAKMLELADDCLTAGAWGMSTGLIYVPGAYARTDELVDVARVVARHGGFYASHVRSEGVELLDAVREAIEIGRAAGLPVHISHMKATGRDAWGSVKAAAALIVEAQKRGQRVTADQYPYTASSTSLEATLVPPWAREGGNRALAARLADPQQSAKLIKQIAERIDAKESIQIAQYAAKPEWQGKTLMALATAERREPIDVVVEMLKSGGASIVNFGMNEDDVRYVMQLSWVATASDGSSRIPGFDQPHPRSFGTFPRKIGRYAIEEKVIPLEAAVHSATSLPAEILGLSSRGRLTSGSVADIAVFDPRKFRDEATYDDPYHYPVGIRYVLVAGELAVYEGTPTGALAGKPLRHSGKTYAGRNAK